MMKTTDSDPLAKDIVGQLFSMMARVGPVTSLDVHQNIPSGWKWVGAGTQRAVIGGPNGWVYKLELVHARGSNQVEWEQYLRIKDQLPPHVAVPRMVRLGTPENPIIASQWVDVPHPPYGCYRHAPTEPTCRCGRTVGGRCWVALMEELQRHLRVEDLTTHTNVALDEDTGKIWLLDLGRRYTETASIRKG